MSVKISEEESQQLLQTVEMFEAIAESQPDDYQSLEILKEAYAKLGRKRESLSATKRLANAYVRVGQAALAILEYESIIQEDPNDPEAREALIQLEAQVTPAETTSETVAPSLVEHSKPTPTAGGPAGAPSPAAVRTRPEDGDRALCNILITEKVVNAQGADPLMAKLQALRANYVDKTLPLSLIPLLVEDQLARIDDLMTILVDKSRLPYMPLSMYDADRDCVRMLPEEICWQHCLMPFDLISRSVLVATANPFDQATRKMVEGLVKYHVFWYVSPPADIIFALRRGLGLENKPTNQTTKR